PACSLSPHISGRLGLRIASKPRFPAPLSRLVCPTNTNTALCPAPQTPALVPAPRAAQIHTTESKAGLLFSFCHSTPSPDPPPVNWSLYTAMLIHRLLVFQFGVRCRVYTMAFFLFCLKF